MFKLLAKFRQSSLCARNSEESINPADIIGWWEYRRIHYNFYVGLAGIFTILLFCGADALGQMFVAPNFQSIPPGIVNLLSIFLYGFMANVCYTGGWITELIARKLSPNEASSFASLSYTLGLFFAVSLSLLPGIIILGISVLRIVIHAFFFPETMPTTHL